MPAVSPPPSLSIIVPVLNDAAPLRTLLQQLAAWRSAAVAWELIVVDGGSSDASAAVAAEGADLVLQTAPGRALQLQTGVAHARGRLLWLLHADSQLQPAHLQQLLTLAQANLAQCWGRFDVQIAGTQPLLPLVAWSMNWRSRLSAICTGDQGMFISANLLQLIGGIPQQALMEDIELSRRLRRLARPRCLRPPLTTAGRRWQQQGFWRTVLLMWWLRLQYFFGVAPAQLARRYYPSS